MRAKEIILEDYTQQLESDVMNLIVGEKAAGITHIDTNKLVNRLQGMGYSVTANSLVSLLQNNPAVLNSSPTVIRLDTSESNNDADNSTPQDSAASVSDMAQKATDKATK